MLLMQRHRFNPWLGKFHMPYGVAKKKKTHTHIYI